MYLYAEFCGPPITISSAPEYQIKADSLASSATCTVSVSVRKNFEEDEFEHTIMHCHDFYPAFH